MNDGMTIPFQNKRSWPVQPLWTVFAPVSRPANPSLPVLSVSIHSGISDKELTNEERERNVWLSEDRSKYQKVIPGDLVYNSMRAWQGGFGACLTKGLVSPAYGVLSPTSTINTKFYELLFRTKGYIALFDTFSPGIIDFRKRLSWDRCKHMKIPVPSLDEQNRIVKFALKVEESTRQVTQSLQHQIDLLDAYRQSLITRAVTKGLDPTVEMKDSGVAWIGHVPSHWKILKLKLVATFSSGGTPDRNNKTYWNDGTIPWLKTGELRNNEILSSEEFITVEGLKNSSAKILPKGTVLIAMYGHTRGMTGLLLAPCACNQACLGISCCKKLFNKYLQFVLISCNTYIREKAIGGGQPNLSQEIIADLKIPLPSMNEQIEIVNRINSISEPIERLTKKLNKSLDCLMEYRSSLISAAVTGQLAIEEAAE